MSKKSPSEAKSTSRRAAGRPSEKTAVGNVAIVNAALDLLRFTVPEKLTVVDVAATANVDPALVRYYYKDKAGLIRAALAHMLADVQQRSIALVTERDSLEHRLRNRLALLIDVLRENPHFLRLVLSEIYHGGAADQNGDTLDTIAHRGLSLSETLLHSDTGEVISQDIDPRFVHVALLGLCTFFMEARPLLEVLFKDGPGFAELTERYLDSVAKMLTRGLIVPDPYTQ